MRLDKSSDVTKNVKIIEWMKKELILSVGDVFDLIFKGVKPLDEALQDTLANIIMITYLLGKRLGISFTEIDYKIKEKIKIGIDQNHSVENWYGDFSNLKKHLNNRE
ncbi:MAG: MazG-like family protein [Peptostreptococcaceae bacterium]